MRAVNQIILQAMLSCRLAGQMSHIVTQMENSVDITVLEAEPFGLCV